MNYFGEDALHGQWHIPQVLNQGLPGLLETGPKQTLTLYGANLTERQKSTLYFQRIPRITGTSGRRPVSILDAHWSSDDPGGIVVFDVGTVVVGAHLTEDRPLEIENEAFELGNLSAWTGRRPVAPDLGGDLGADRIRYEAPPVERATLEDGRVELRSMASTQFSRTEASITHRDLFNITLDRPHILDSFLRDYARPLRYLLALATSVTPIVDRIYSSVRQRDQTERHPVEIRLCPRSIEPEMISVHGRAMIFTLNDVEFDGFVPKWFSVVARLGASCDLLFDRGSASFITNRFFDIASATEAAHHAIFGSRSRATPSDRARIDRIARALEGEDAAWVRGRLGHSFTPNYQTRLRELVDFVGTGAYLYTQGGGLGGLENWADPAAQYRNRIAHSRDIDSIIWQDLVYLETSLSGILRLVLFRELGYSQSECHKLAVRQLNVL